MSEQVLQTLPSTIETIDGAFLEYVEGLNLFCNTINGWDKVPVIWSSAERAYQIKNNRELRDKNGSLIPPIISIERSSVTKDPNKKGAFQSNLSPNNDRYVYAKVLNQDKTANFANADTLKTRGQINFVTSKKNQKQVYKFISVPIPVYVTVEYKINILTNYQSQMNEIMQPFMSRVAQNYFLIKKDGYRYESFMDQNFQQEAINLGEEERKYKSTINVKVLGYLIGEGANQEKPQIIEQENAVELKFPKETLMFVGEDDQGRGRTLPQNNIGVKQLSTSVLVKKVFIIGDGVNSTYTLTHGYNSKDILVRVRENLPDSDFAQVEVAIGYNDLNEITIDMGEIIPIDSYAVMILG